MYLLSWNNLPRATVGNHRVNKRTRMFSATSKTDEEPTNFLFRVAVLPNSTALERIAFAIPSPYAPFKLRHQSSIARHTKKVFAIKDELCALCPKENKIYTARAMAELYLSGSRRMLRTTAAYGDRLHKDYRH